MSHSEEVTDAGEQELHTDTDQEKAEDSRHRVDAALSKKADHRTRQPKHHKADEKGQCHAHNDGDVDQAPVFRTNAFDLDRGGQHHGYRAWARQAGHGERDEGNIEVLLLLLRRGRRGGPQVGEHHAKADRRDDQSPGHPDSRYGYAEEVDDRSTEQKEKYQDSEGVYATPKGLAVAGCFVPSGSERYEQGCSAEGICDRQEGADRQRDRLEENLDRSSPADQSMRRSGLAPRCGTSNPVNPVDRQLSCRKRVLPAQRSQ